MGTTVSRHGNDESPKQFLKCSSRTPRNIPSGPALNLVLIGKTGHGKSATGNSILGKEIFDAKLSFDSQTSRCKMEHAVIGTRKIYLIDTPGTMDTNDPEKALKEICTAIVLRPEGFHAFLLVLNAGARFTAEERMAVLMMKKMFGDNVLTRYTVPIFTHGDSFYNQLSKSKPSMSFIDYICSQGGEIYKLVQECNNRCVLMNNMECDPYAKQEQVIQLIEVIDTLVAENNGKMYTNELFVYAQLQYEEERKKEQEELDYIRKERQKIQQMKMEFERIKTDIEMNKER